MNRLKETNQLKKTEKQLEKQLLSPQYVDLNKMFHDSEAYLVAEADMKEGIILGTGQTKEGELAIEVSKKESDRDNLLIQKMATTKYTHKSKGKNFELEIGNDVTELTTPHFVSGVNRNYKLVLFELNEENRTIRVVFKQQLVYGEDQSIIGSPTRIEYFFNAAEYKKFEDTVALPLLKKTLLDGLLKNNFNADKYFDPTTEDATEDNTGKVKLV